ncbi:MAG: hypothetical protein KME07_04235 [Pegethrix bostrychoides GSE-TBD4-15B]|jgi:hypothetical protein|uniref:Uncharacterized protein n=1 Tax=Pegethrix bostrychoides GSE-TBD4-15B TaxID=2839662 RepID=A0A951P7V5_9CYAN|nr:hypothetical protein [Pegethrix bostrychoides GSE-TBD4-15B]
MFDFTAQKVVNWWTAWSKADAQTESVSSLANSQQSNLSLQLSRQALEGAAFALSGSPSSDAMAWLRLARPELFVSPVSASAPTPATTPVALELELELESNLEAEADCLLSSTVSAIDSTIDAVENTATWAVS